MFKIRTWEPGPVLGNLDLNKTLVGDPYSRTWTCTWEPGSVLVYVLKCLRIVILVTICIILNLNKFRNV
jgi:hypothetical protein